MIERIVIENFKSLRKVDLSLGRVNLLIGTNASGKSNFLEALRMLEGIGNGFTIDEILNGKPKGATSEVWEGIRGGSAHACFTGIDGEVAITSHGTLKESLPMDWKYHISFLPSNKGIVTEEIRASRRGGCKFWGKFQPSATAYRCRPRRFGPTRHTRLP